MTRNLVWAKPNIDSYQKNILSGHSSFTLWLTGLSGSGKSTLAQELEVKLYDMGVHTVILDGDNLRHGLCRDLDFSEYGRLENIRRVGEVSKLFVDAGIVALVSLISPYREARDEVRNLFDDESFIEVFVKCGIDTCIKRDPKGLYQKVKKEGLRGFTGIDSPYEEPFNPEIVIDTEISTIEECVVTIIDYLKSHERLNVISKS